MMRDERNEDKPAYSRVFVVCDKQLPQTELRSIFEKYGEIEALHMPKDRNTGESKGIAYIKFDKTSSAAAAIDGLHMKHMQNNNKPLKVMVATNKSEEKSDNENKYRRLFIKVSKETTDSDIKDSFSKFGNVEHVHLQKDRDTNECRGFAYVRYRSFSEAAKAFEECDKKYKCVFATPKEELKRTRTNFESFDRYSSSDSVYMRENKYDIPNHHKEHNPRDSMVKKDSIMPLIKTTPEDYDTVNVSCAPCVPQKSLEKLFNIIPGMTQFKFSEHLFNGVSSAVVKYDSKVAAAHAVAKLNNYEFPSGQKISVKPENTLSNVANSLSQIVNSFKSSLDSNSDLMQLADVIAQASTLLKNASTGVDVKSDDYNADYCNVPLPPVKPKADANARVAKRCFLVFRPHPLPAPILQDIFCRFGDLIEVNVIPNKKFGFAKYASVQSATDAIHSLNNATVHDVLLKVLEADEVKKEPRDRTLDDDEYEDSKRARFDSK